MQSEHYSDGSLVARQCSPASRHCYGNGTKPMHPTTHNSQAITELKHTIGPRANMVKNSRAQGTGVQWLYLNSCSCKHRMCRVAISLITEQGTTRVRILCVVAAYFHLCAINFPLWPAFMLCVNQSCQNCFVFGSFVVLLFQGFLAFPRLLLVFSRLFVFLVSY